MTPERAKEEVLYSIWITLDKEIDTACDYHKNRAYIKALKRAQEIVGWYLSDARKEGK